MRENSKFTHTNTFTQRQTEQQFEIPLIYVFERDRGVLEGTIEEIYLFHTYIYMHNFPNVKPRQTARGKSVFVTHRQTTIESRKQKIRERRHVGAR